MMLDLPHKFVETIQNTFGEKGKRWLQVFPALLDEASRRWGLTDIQPVPNLSYNFVAFAQLRPESNVSRRWLQSQAPFGDDKTLQSASVILKLGVPNRELTSEIAALRYYNGHGACRLLEADAEKGMLLLERLQPGRTLSTLVNDERATRIAAEVMRQLWRPAPENRKGFIQLKDWFNGFERLRKQYQGKTGPLPKSLVETAESLSRELLAEYKGETLLHGDFHHFNVLKSERGWLAIDPKGVIGPRGYEVGPLLINPVPDFLNGDKPQVQTKRRIAILAEMLVMERERICSWGICHAVLSAWWSIEDNDPGQGEYSLRCAEFFMQV
jgi:streptomycin 6-kinase